MRYFLIKEPTGAYILQNTMAWGRGDGAEEKMKNRTVTKWKVGKREKKKEIWETFLDNCIQHDISWFAKYGGGAGKKMKNGAVSEKKKKK